jgi:hypothetical protein
MALPPVLLVGNYELAPDHSLKWTSFLLLAVVEDR